MSKINNKISIPLLIILSVSAVLAHAYCFEIMNPDLRIYEKLLNTGTENLDFPKQIYLEQELRTFTVVLGKSIKDLESRYRILAPHLSKAIYFIFDKTASIFMPHRNPKPWLRSVKPWRDPIFFASLAIYYLLVIFFLLASLFYWARIWFSNEQALLGVLFIAGTISIAFRHHYYMPWSFLEVGLFTSSFIAMYRKRYALLALLLVFAAFNRETSAFIVLAFFFVSLDEIRGLKIKKWITSKALLLTAAYTLIWAVIYFGLIFYIGGSGPAASSSIPIIGEWSQKGELSATFTKWGIFETLKDTTLFLGVFWGFAILGFKKAPLFVRRISLIIPFYILAFYTGSSWWETRNLMVLYPMLLVLGLSYLFPAHPDTEK